MAIRNFEQGFLDHYHIESFFKPNKKGGQKDVHFVIRNGAQQVMKLFDGGKDGRFEREMKIYEKYKEIDGIPNIYQIDEYHGEIVVFEEYIEGETLSDITSKYKGDGKGIRDLLKNVFEILTPVWQGRYVHRDLKPENIIIRPDGKPVILDFGIARDLESSSITGTGVQPGTWKWAAPEQYAGQKDVISYRTDFFSLGIIAYYLYYQRLPFGNTVNDIDLRYKGSDESFTTEDTCELNKFLMEAMKFRPSHRPRDIDDLIILI